ncbi:MAG: HDIG domain-containing protein [Desulfuromonadaceae bacterium]|nr:HDIG domain-containing protein [Desulfuromonadaceae bacterium]
MTGKNLKKQQTVSARTRMQRHLLLLTLALVLAFVVVPKGGFVPDYYRPGDIASRDVKSPRGFLVPEPALTEKKRQDAAAAVLAVYDYDARPSSEVAHNLVNAFQALRQQHKQEELRQQLAAAEKEAKSKAVLEGSVPSEGTVPLGPVDAVSEVNLNSLLGTELDDKQTDALHRLALDEAFVGAFSAAVQKTLKRRIVGSLELFRSQWRGAMTVRDLATREEANVEQIDDVLGINEILAEMRTRVEMRKALQGDYSQLLGLLQKVLHPNLTYNQSETEARRRTAAEAVLPVLLQVKPGEMIVREGERVTEDQIRKLKALRESVDLSKGMRTGAGLVLAILLLFYAVHRFARGNIRKYRPQMRDQLFLVLVFSVLFVLLKLGIFMSTAMQSSFPYIDSPCYYYALPFAAGAMLVRIVLNSETAFIFSVLFALMTGLLFGDNLFMAIYALSGSLTAAHWVRHSQARSNLYRAGWYLSLLNMGMVVAIHMVAGHAFDVQLLYRLGFGFIGGFLCAVIVNGTIPLMESLFKYTTDFRLMELANMNTPILRELMIQAPGTYHHSIIVGNLVENAAEAIGANPLLARVAAYYHDIGKIRKPLYFAENIRNQENRHDKLAPSMSALILISHLKDGVELARENKLGQELIDIIRQHHGTSLIKFFYDKAQQREKDGQVNEQDYRYPGPKPQTREAALIMLADAVEAAGRTLSDPTSARIQGMVQKIINNIFIDGQLDECELTLKDLHEIAKSFNRILSGIFHQRIDYPEPAYKERTKEREADARSKNSEDLHRESADQPRDSAGTAAPSGTDDLKRLGMS